MGCTKISSTYAVLGGKQMDEKYMEELDPVEQIPDLADQEPENAMETEEQIRERVRAELSQEYDRYIDQRITQARKKWESKKARETAESLDRVNKLRAIESQERRRELELKEHELSLKALRLDIVDLIDAEEMSGGFRQLIPYEDLLAIPDPAERYRELKKRIINLKVEFHKLVDQEVKKQISSLQMQKRGMV